MSLSRLWHQQGKPKKAHDLLVEVYAWFTEGFDTADLQEAKALLEELAQRPHSAGTSTGAPLALITNTRNLAGLVLLAFRSTT